MIQKLKDYACQFTTQDSKDFDLNEKTLRIKERASIKRQNLFVEYILFSFHGQHFFRKKNFCPGGSSQPGVPPRLPPAALWPSLRDSSR